MTDQLTEHIQKLKDEIEADEAAALVKWRRHIGVSGGVREMYNIFTEAAYDAKAAARTTQSRVEALRADDVMNPEGRKRLVAEAIADGKAKVKKHQERMGAALKVLEAQLYVCALPRLDRTREAAARDEFRLIMDRTRDPVGTILELAQRDDEIGAVAASSYGESYLRGSGVYDAKDLAEKVRNAAAASADRSSDPGRCAAAEARAELVELAKVRDRVSYLTSTTLQAADPSGAGV